MGSCSTGGLIGQVVLVWLGTHMSQAQNAPQGGQGADRVITGPVSVRVHEIGKVARIELGDGDKIKLEKHIAIELGGATIIARISTLYRPLYIDNRDEISNIIKELERKIDETVARLVEYYTNVANVISELDSDGYRTKIKVTGEVEVIAI